MGKGRAKDKSAIPVRGPRFAVVRVGESEAGGWIGWAEKSYGRRWMPDQAEREGSGRQERMMLRVISA